MKRIDEMSTNHDHVCRLADLYAVWLISVDIEAQLFYSESSHDNWPYSRIKRDRIRSPIIIINTIRLRWIHEETDEHVYAGFRKSCPTRLFETRCPGTS